MEELVSRITNLRVVTEIDGEANIFATAVRSFTLGFDPPLTSGTWSTEGS